MTWNFDAMKVLHHSSQNTIVPFFLSAGYRVENKLAKLHVIMTQSSMLSSWLFVFYLHQFLYLEVKSGGRNSPALS